MALTQISTGGVKDDAVTAGKIPANAIGSSEIAKPIDLADDEKIRLGTGNDLEIFHDGTNSFITNGTGYLKITGPTNTKVLTANFELLNAAENEYLIRAVEDSYTALYYDGVKTFSTTSNGINILGPEGGAAQLDFNADEGDDNADKWKMYIPDGGAFHLQNKASGSWENSLIANSDAGGVELYYDNSKKVETTSAGVTVTGTVSDSLGDLRSIPENARGTTYTLVATDAGKCVTQTHSSGFTIDNSVFSAGDAVTMINNSGSDQTITQGSGVTLYNSADASSGNRTLASRGMATVWFQSASVGYISGAGLS